MRDPSCVPHTNQGWVLQRDIIHILLRFDLLTLLLEPSSILLGSCLYKTSFGGIKRIVVERYSCPLMTFVAGIFKSPIRTACEHITFIDSVAHGMDPQ